MSVERDFGYGIVIKLNPEFAAHAASLNAVLASHLPYLENPKNIWHVTLFQGVYEQQHLPKIWEEVTKIDFSNIRLNFSKIYTTHTAEPGVGHSWVDWLVDKTPELDAVHAKVVEVASPYHKENLPRCADIESYMTDAQKDLMAKYGVTGLFESYKPHTTLFYHHPHDKALDVSATSLEESYDMGCFIKTVIFGELGYDGNIVKEIYSHNVPATGETAE